MTLNLIKLCVGIGSVDELAQWQVQNRRRKSRDGKVCFYHRTFQTPKRQAELLDGGSLYWVIRGTILARQALIGFEAGKKDDGTPCCLLMFAPPLIMVRPMSRRAFQGWRYLEAADAPPDLRASGKDQVASMPIEMQKRLADLCLI